MVDIALSSVESDKSTADESNAQQSQIKLSGIADRVLVATASADPSHPSLTRDTAISASTLARIIAASPDLLKCISGSSSLGSRPLSETVISWAALASGECSAETKRALAGATVLFLSADFCEAVGWLEIDGLRRLGVARLMMPHPYLEDGSVISLSMRVASGWRERIDLFLLGRAAIGRRVLRNAWAERGLMWVAGPSLEIPANEREMSDRFALFEGTRQLPPLPVSHDAIRRFGGGRNSVWGHHIFFSSTRVGRPPTAIWMVPCNHATRRRLKFASEILVPPMRKQRSLFLDEFRAIIGNEGAVSGQLKLSAGERVVVLTHALPPGGAERQWCYLAGDLKRMGYDVHFVTLFPLEGQSRHYVPLLAREGIDITELDKKFDQSELLGALREALDDVHRGDFGVGTANPFGSRLHELVNLFLRLRPRAVFAQLDYANLIAGAAGILASVPQTVLSFRNYNPTRFSYLRNDWYQPLYSALARSPRILLTGNSSASNADYAQWMGIEEHRVKLVPNSIDIATIEASDEDVLQELRQRLGVTSCTPIILGVFRLSEEKRPLLFVDTFAAVVARSPQARGFVAGVGPFEEQMRARIGELGLQDSLTLLGRRDDVADLMQISSLLLLTSSFEGMPNVVMEAQAMHLPVVAPSVGGVADCMVDGATGYLVDRDDVAGFARRCIELLSDDQLRSRFGVNGAAYMRSSFSRRAMAERYLQVLQGETATPLEEFKTLRAAAA